MHGVIHEERKGKGREGEVKIKLMLILHTVPSTGIAALKRGLRACDPALGCIDLSTVDIVGALLIWLGNLNASLAPMHRRATSRMASIEDDILPLVCAVSYLLLDFSAGHHYIV